MKSKKKGNPNNNYTPRSKSSKAKSKPVHENALEDLVNTMRLSQMVSGHRTGGAQVASYETISRNNNYSLLTFNWADLTYLYSSNGIVKTVINLPIQDALSKGIEIISNDLSPEQIEKLLNFMERENQWEILRRAWAWARLYGGGALIINTNQDPSTPLNLQSLHNAPLTFYDVDRWQINTPTHLEQLENNPDGYFHLHGVKIHVSRILLAKGESPPYHQRKILRGWSLSECEHIVPALNQYLKTKEVTFELLDEAKIDILKFEGLAEALRNDPGYAVAAAERQVELATETKDFRGVIVMDKNDEYESKQQTFSGLAEIMSENRYEIASVVKMPLTKLFGIPATGFNSGESDLESYNQMVESNVREKMKPIIRQIMELNMFNLWGRKFEFTLKWPPLRSLNSTEEQEVKTAKFNRTLESFKEDAISKEEFREIVQAEQLFPTTFDEKEKDSQDSQDSQDSETPTISKTMTIRKNSTRSGLSQFIKGLSKK